MKHNEEWKDFVQANYKIIGVEHMAYLLGVQMSVILDEFPFLRRQKPARPIQSMIVVMPREG